MKWMGHGELIAWMAPMPNNPIHHCPFCGKDLPITLDAANRLSSFRDNKPILLICHVCGELSIIKKSEKNELLVIAAIGEDLARFRQLEEGLYQDALAHAGTVKRSAQRIPLNTRCPHCTQPLALKIIPSFLNKRVIIKTPFVCPHCEKPGMAIKKDNAVEVVLVSNDEISTFKKEAPILYSFFTDRLKMIRRIKAENN